MGGCAVLCRGQAGMEIILPQRHGGMESGAVLCSFCPQSRQDPDDTSLPHRAGWGVGHKCVSRLLPALWAERAQSRLHAWRPRRSLARCVVGSLQNPALHAPPDLWQRPRHVAQAAVALHQLAHRLLRALPRWRVGPMQHLVDSTEEQLLFVVQPHKLLPALV